MIVPIKNHQIIIDREDYPLILGHNWQEFANLNILIESKSE
jgi:hypothetical protein